MGRGTLVATDRFKRMRKEVDVLHFITNIEWTLKPRKPLSRYNFVSERRRIITDDYG
jgi:hypothetical protein